MAKRKLGDDARYDVSLIVPTRNEEKIAEKNFMVLYKYLKKSSRVKRFEIIVCDHSTDSTPTIAKKLAKKYKEFRYLYVPRRGIGSGVTAGLKAAKYDVIEFYSIDLTYDISFLDGALSYLDRFDIVLGSRGFRKLAPIKSWKRKFFSKCYNVIVNVVFDLGIRDTQGLFMVKGEKVKKFLDRLTSPDGFMQTQLLVYGKKYGLHIKEVPVLQRDRSDKDSNINPVREGMSIVKNILRTVPDLYFKR